MTIKSTKFETLKLFFFLFSHWYVKQCSSKCIALKIDVIVQENTLFAGASFSLEILLARAVKGLITPLFLTVYSPVTFQRVEVYHESDSEDTRLKGTVQI